SSCGQQGRKEDWYENALHDSSSVIRTSSLRLHDCQAAGLLLPGSERRSANRSQCTSRRVNAENREISETGIGDIDKLSSRIDRYIKRRTVRWKRRTGNWRQST